MGFKARMSVKASANGAGGGGGKQSSSLQLRVSMTPTDRVLTLPEYMHTFSHLEFKIYSVFY